MKSKDNYRLQVEGAKKYFLRYDQARLIRKLDLRSDEDWLYTQMLCTDYRIHRTSGNVERLDAIWEETNDHGEVMTLLDLVCDSKENRFRRRTQQRSHPKGRRTAQSRGVFAYLRKPGRGRTGLR